MRSQIGDCSSCTSRHFCKELCPDAERIIGVESIPQNPNEHLSGLLPPKPLPHVDNLTHLTTTERKIVTLLGQGLTRAEVCEELEINRVTLRKHLSRAKKKYLK